MVTSVVSKIGTTRVATGTNMESSMVGGAIFMCGDGLITFLFRRSTYPGTRNTPWESTPRRLAHTSEALHSEESGCATPAASKRAVTNCASAGLVSNNLWLYLAWPSLENLVYATAFLGSALLGTPLLALYAQRLYPIPAPVRASHAFRRAFIVVSSAWFCGHAVRAVVRLWLLSNLPIMLSRCG